MPRKSSDVRWMLQGEPRPAQVEALRRSYLGVRTRDRLSDTAKLERFRPGIAPGWGHFMEMRVGKTPVTLNEFALMRYDDMVDKLFVMAPSSYKSQWPLEADLFGLDVTPLVFSSQNRGTAKAALASANPPNMLVTNYEALTSTANMSIFDEFVDDRTMVVADESVYLKNPKSIRFKRARALAKEARIVRALTGLPAPNAPYDLWSQLTFTGSLTGWSFYQFKYRFTIMGGYKNKQALGIKNEDELDMLLDSMSWRARRAEWSQTLNTDFMEVPVVMTDGQQSNYLTMEREFVAYLESGKNVTASIAVAKHAKLQQISSGILIDEDGDWNEIESIRNVPKFVDLHNRLSNEICGKTIVVAHYRHTVERLLSALKSFNPALIAGGGTMHEHGRDVDEEKARFNNDPKCRVLIGQSQALRYGHTLMGTPDDPCLTLVFFENNYSLDARRQCEERPQGVQQVGPLCVIDYHSSGIERHIIRALRRKQDVSDVIMGYYGAHMARPGPERHHVEA